MEKVFDLLCIARVTRVLASDIIQSLTGLFGTKMERREDKMNEN